MPTKSEIYLNRIDYAVEIRNIMKLIYA